MSSRKEEERNEKIIRGLLKLPPNRRCINCNSLGPQYVCTNFWTFICIACSGIHREFTHRVKSVSMAKFTTQEVESLQRGGNQRAKEQFLKDWDTERLRLPDNSNPDKIREFIKSVYVDKKYAGGRSSDKPPRDTQSLKGHEEDLRRASSYHSFSQSPPYDHQYEERRNGKQAGMLTRKPGSDRGHYYEGKVSSFMYSPGQQGEEMYEDRFANEGSNPRMSDFLVSSAGDPSRSGVQSPSTNDPRYSSPPQVRDIFVEDTLPKKLNASSDSLVKGDTDKIPHPHRTASSGSFGSFDSNSLSFKSGNSGSLIDAILEPEHTAGVQQTEPSTFPSLSQISSAHATNQDLFGPSFLQPPTSNFASSIDLFSDSSQLPSLTNLSEQKTPSSENEGWATFDFPHHVEPSFEASKSLPSLMPPSEGTITGKIDVFSSMHNSTGWFSAQNSTDNGQSFLMGDQWHVGTNEVKDFIESRNAQPWDAFDDSTGSIPQTSFEMLLQNKSQVPLHHSIISNGPHINFNAPENEFLSVAMNDGAHSFTAVPGTGGPSLPPSLVPPAGGTNIERKSMNPFDLPNDLNPEINSLFMDVSSLQEALPDKQPPNTFLAGLPDPWLLVPSVPQGGLAHIGGQVPSSQLPNVLANDPVTPLGGNPFA
ncbi:putative ADP-ribosylation factor GTPase-activating protein AGD14 isoform X2 [Iris pallida]|uniref:ADP-ribosylation factor GTPase-activating protein AGD14 isoform X2 n=1 Tax=Iris pallida TaxID=29817 RepID=A0AAX6F2L5_IRIPA|nr:putative ADP-ribosylation factor GTPase-activating protein AGD14 isoform X2 [Iris pallida]